MQERPQKITFGEMREANNLAPLWRQPAPRESCGAAHDNHPTKAVTKSELVAEPRRATKYKFMLAASFGHQSQQESGLVAWT